METRGQISVTSTEFGGLRQIRSTSLKFGPFSANLIERACRPTRRARGSLHSCI
jgi:hypothetical protein